SPRLPAGAYLTLSMAMRTAASPSARGKSVPAAPVSRARPASGEAWQLGTRTTAGISAASAARAMRSTDSGLKYPCSVSTTRKSKPASASSSTAPSVGHVRNAPSRFSRASTRARRLSAIGSLIRPVLHQVELQHLGVRDPRVEVLAGDLQVQGEPLQDELHSDRELFLGGGREALLDGFL